MKKRFSGLEAQDLSTGIKKKRTFLHIVIKIHFSKGEIEWRAPNGWRIPLDIMVIMHLSKALVLPHTLLWAVHIIMLMLLTKLNLKYTWIYSQQPWLLLHGRQAGWPTKPYEASSLATQVYWYTRRKAYTYTAALLVCMQHDGWMVVSHWLTSHMEW